MTDESQEKANFEAQWTKNDTDYNFSGRIELEELKEIIKYMKFQSDFLRFLTYILCKGMFTQ